jgi:hypothetical protein
MSMVVPLTLVALVAVLVFAAGSRMCAPQNAIAGGVGALLLFLLHPVILAGISNSSPWDALFVMLFVCAWLWMEHWSLFMRSWVLAGVYALGLWLGSPFVLWTLVALIPWVIFNRRPLDAAICLFTIFLGGIFLFTVSWGVAWLVIPNLGRPIFTQWIRWSGPQLPPSLSLPWCLLVFIAVLDRFKEMAKNRRADAATFSAMLLVVTALFGSSLLRMAMIALAAPLIMRVLAKREFLFHRGVRGVAAVTFILCVGLAYSLRDKHAWISAGLSIILVGVGARLFYNEKRLPWRLAGEAACVGAYAAGSLGSLLHLIPQ